MVLFSSLPLSLPLSTGGAPSHHLQPIRRSSGVRSACTFLPFASFLLPHSDPVPPFIYSEVSRMPSFLKLLPSAEVTFTGSNILQSYEACIALNYIAVPARSSHIFEYESSQGSSFPYRVYICCFKTFLTQTPKCQPRRPHANPQLGGCS